MRSLQVFFNGDHCSGRCDHIHYATERGGKTRCTKYNAQLRDESWEDYGPYDGGPKRLDACMKGTSP